MNATRIKAWALFAALTLTGSFVDAQSPAQPARKSGEQDLPNDHAGVSKFLRVATDENGDPRSLQTSITRFKSPDGRVLVDLVGAVHIGERDYYKRINRQLSQYDAVLYELVAPQGTRVPRGGRRDTGLSLLGWLQDSSRQMLGLESQLELIDYQRDNFVHADLSPSEIADHMAERGDTPLSVGLAALAEMIDQQRLAASKLKSDPDAAAVGPTSLQEVVELMGNPLELKRMMATQFTATGSIEMGLGKTLNQLLVSDRNQAAMQSVAKTAGPG